jgi:hypothetical protein
MKYILILFLLVLTESSFSQKEIDYKIDSGISVTISENYKIYDTLGQHLIAAEFKSNKVIITKISFTDDKTFNLRTPEDLTRSYKGIISGVLERSKGKLLHQEIVDKSNFRLNTFVYQALLNGNPFTIECVGFYLNKNMYMVQICKPNTESYSNSEALNLLKISKDLSITNQLDNSQVDDSYELGYKLGYYIFWPLFLIIVVILLVRRFRKKK